jgi:phospholipase D1/2
MSMSRILERGRNCLGIFAAGETGLLIDGRDYYRAFWEAAGGARRYILMAGWQFDSNVLLLRGADRREAAGDARLLPFLNRLCSLNPDLEVYVLAWDFNTVYALRREWFQKLIFEWSSGGRINFRFDSAHPLGASHHQKFIVIDGALAFAGGMDLCEARWDDRRHLAENRDRTGPGGAPYGPYHDIQSCHTGPAAAALAEVFRMRWENSGGGPLHLPEPAEPAGRKTSFTLPLGAGEVAISRTAARTIVPMREPVLEIRRLYLDAIGAAEELIYMENQYFSSQAVYRALVDRLRARDRPRLEVVIVIPKAPHTFLEEVAMGLAQVKMLHSIREVAKSEGHDLGIYYCLPGGDGAEEEPVYIHAKLLVVDDRFLTVGSANTNNRSMGLDTELNVSWEADPASQPELAGRIAGVRADLIAEHAGMDDPAEARKTAAPGGLVKRLDRLADAGACRLRRHTLETLFVKTDWFSGIKPEELSIDPERPVIEENLYEMMNRDRDGLFARGIGWLNELLREEREG